MRKASKMLLALSLVVPTFLSPVATSANTRDGLSLTRETARGQFELGASTRSVRTPELEAARARHEARGPLTIEAAPNVPDVEPFVNNRLNDAITSREAVDTEMADIEALVENWSDEEIEAFDALLNTNGDAFWDLIDTPGFELAFPLVHYYWLSLDFNVDFLEIILGLSMDDFTDEDIHRIEALIEEFVHFDLLFWNALIGVEEEGMPFDEASALVIESTEGFLNLAPQFEAELGHLAGTPEEPTWSWTEEELAALTELLATTEEAFWIAADLIEFALLITDMEPEVAAERFGFDADDIANFEAMIEEFYAADELFWIGVAAIYEETATFEEIVALLTESEERFLALTTELNEIIEEFRVEPWTDAETNAFWELFWENWDALDEVAFPLSMIDIFNLDVTEEQQIVIDRILGDIEQLDTLFFNTFSDASLGLITFEEAVARMTESTEGFLALAAELVEVFEVAPWTEEEAETFFEALLISDNVMWDLFSNVDFAFILSFYHYMGQDTDLDLVYILFGLELTDEDMVTLEALIEEFWALDEAHFMLIMLHFSDNRIVSLDQALEINARNKEGALELDSQFRAIIGGTVIETPSEGLTPEDLLRELLFEIGLLQLEEEDFTTDSWAILEDAITEATSALEANDNDAIVLAHAYLQEALDGLETVNGGEPTPPTRPSFPEITLPEIDINIPGLPVLPFVIGTKSL